MHVRRRSSIYECRGFVIEPRAVVSGTLVRSDLMAQGNAAFPEGLNAGTQRSCDLTIEGPLPPGEFVARVDVPRLEQWLRIRVVPDRVAGNRVTGPYTVLDHGKLG
ncbi:hypothetical protein [Deinococcus peraridilitoris]|uniref:Uncharacterized protein n=1 Tax=Deinococcus peraridilitoris (strain DSM 19664 / LMG 22246 / CIP 109416 / KR-200) TaxID=937777 RepID=L0A093_DEIPD|nr:hypothetical protein [Deinococcus peraridilitoris]AFZ67308.1 hypothetical protein Deipe_1789 [Deinococcus peraridilitoris DSM 19664]